MISSFSRLPDDMALLMPMFSHNFVPTNTTSYSNFVTGLVYLATGFLCVFVKHKRKKSARNEKD